MAIYCLMSVMKEVIEEAGFVYEISSGLEGEHMIASLHYIGDAVDWAIRSPVYGNQGQTLADRCNSYLNEDFDVIWNPEKKVLHGEWQPKTSFGKLGE